MTDRKQLEYTIQTILEKKLGKDFILWALPAYTTEFSADEIEEIITRLAIKVIKDYCIAVKERKN